MENDDKMGEMGDTGELGEKSSSDLLEVGFDEAGFGEAGTEPLDLDEPGRGGVGNAEYEPHEGCRFVRITVPVDSAEESDVSDDLAAIGCGRGCGTSLNSCGRRCEPRASSLLGTFARGMASTVLGSPLPRECFLEAGRILALSSLGVGCDNRLRRVGAGALTKERSWYECRDCDPFIPSRSVGRSFALRILNGAIA